MKSDPNLSVHDSKQLYVLAHVDDLMFFGSQADVSTLIKDQKDLLLKVTGTLDEGQSSSFLGRNLKRTSTFISGATGALLANFCGFQACSLTSCMLPRS